MSKAEPHLPQQGLALGAQHAQVGDGHGPGLICSRQQPPARQHLQRNFPPLTNPFKYPAIPLHATALITGDGHAVEDKLRDGSNKKTSTLLRYLTSSQRQQGRVQGASMHSIASAQPSECCSMPEKQATWYGET